MKMDYRVLLVDDHAIVRAGVKMLLEKQTNIEVVGEATDGREGVKKTLFYRPDLVIMDLSMPPGMNGLEATKKIKESLPDTMVLILTMHDDENDLFQGLQAGASGYVLKNALDSELLTAIEKVMKDQVYLYPSETRSLIEDFLQRVKQGEDLSTYKLLSEREEEVLILITKGYSNKEIADQLFISVKTVETHKSNLMNKLGFQKRYELVEYALNNGLLKKET